MRFTPPVRLEDAYETTAIWLRAERHLQRRRETDSKQTAVSIIFLNQTI